MIRKNLLFLFLSFVAMSVFAQTSIKDVRTHPECYFLQTGDVASSLQLLPPPPAPGSTLFQNDEARYKWGKAQRNTPRGDQAYTDSNLDGEGVAYALSEAFGIKISKETTPEIYKLVAKMREDAGDLATREAKIITCVFALILIIKSKLVTRNSRLVFQPMVLTPPDTRL